MAMIDEKLLKISKKYLFSTIEKKRDELRKTLGENQLVDLGVGDISLPLAPSIVEGLKEGAHEMERSVIGYGPYEGYAFLREAIVQSEYSHVDVGLDEIFVSEGINGDLCGMQELFSPSARVGIIDPAYPVYLTLNILSGRETIVTLPLKEENGYMPKPPKEGLDLVFLTSPGNPIGIAQTRENLQEWVNLAKQYNAIIFFDAAYASFIQSKEVPKTIYEIEGARDVAIEFRSFSKSSGFTGVRLGYTVVPKNLFLKSAEGKDYSINALWMNRQSTKTNGISYPIQRAGLAALTPQGKAECMAQVKTYLAGAKKMKETLQNMGYTVVGGVDSPYLWWKVPYGSSWEWFDKLIEECHLISIPGEGFGKWGEGYVRLSGFVNPATCEKAILHLKRLGVLSAV